MTVVKKPVRCKVEVECEMIEQVISSKYLGIVITSSKDIALEVRENVLKGMRISFLFATKFFYGKINT